MIVAHKLKMSLEEEELLQRLEMPLGDVSARKIEMQLYANQGPWTIPEDVTVLIQYRKPDGTQGEYDTLPDGSAAWSASGNVLTLSLAPQVLTVAGSVVLYASLYLEEAVLHTFAVEICVRAPYVSRSAGRMVSSQDYYYVTSVLRGPITAQAGDVLVAGAVDTYGRVTEVEAQSAAELVREKSEAILHTKQTLTDDQKAQARENIRALAHPTRTTVTPQLHTQLSLSDFAAEEDWSIWYAEKQDWLNSAEDFDFTLALTVGGKDYTLTKADCTITDMGSDGNHAWMVAYEGIDGFVLHIGNGQHPVTLAVNGQFAVAFANYTPSSLQLQFYKNQAAQEDAAVVTSVNGALPDENGNVEIVIPGAQPAVLYEAQTLTDAQKEQARENIGASPGGYGWGETRAAAMPDGDANNALTTGLYRAISTTANAPEGCDLIFVQAASSGIIYQTAYCADGMVMRMNDHDVWSGWKRLDRNKVYEQIATVTVAADENGNLPQYVTFSADSEGNAFQLTDFFVRAYAGFADGSQSTLYVSANGNLVIANSAIASISSSCRYFNVFLRQEDDGFKRVEHTSSSLSTNSYDPQSGVVTTRMIPPMSTVADAPINKIELYTATGTTKAWVEGSTFELWGVRA